MELLMISLYMKLSLTKLILLIFSILYWVFGLVYMAKDFFDRRKDK